MMQTPGFGSRSPDSSIVLALELSPPWQGRFQDWSLAGTNEKTVASWQVSIRADESLPQPAHALFESVPAFRDTTCTLSLPGFAGEIDPDRRYAQLRAHPAATAGDIHYFLRVVAALALFQQGNLLVHAAGIVTSAGVLLFTGQSGSGKSTISALAGERTILHDDLVYLRPQDQGWQVHALPSVDSAQAASYPLRGVLLLAHAPNNYLSSVHPAVALAEGVANSPVINAAPAFLPQLFSYWRSLLESIPLQRLHFRPDPSFWKVLDDQFG